MYLFVFLIMFLTILFVNDFGSNIFKVVNAFNVSKCFNDDSSFDIDSNVFDPSIFSFLWSEHDIKFKVIKI